MELDNNWVDVSVTRGPIRGKDRNRIGLIIRIRARRDVEEFMSGLAQGRRLQVEAVGDMWQNCTPEAGPLEFYETDGKFDAARSYSLDHVAAAPLIQQEVRGLRAAVIPNQNDETVNLAFLRLVGISNESGVTIGLVGPYSNDYIRRMKLLLPKALTQFLQDYIVPITVNLQIISKS
jgi:hypothetical protein